jgi:hypothetical protein
MSSSKEPNKNLENLIKTTTDTVRYGKAKYNQVTDIINKTPIQIKFANVILPFVLTYIFTNIYYNLGLSIFFAILTSIAIAFLSKMMTIIFIILYIVVAYNKYNERQITVGYPIAETDIVKNGVPYNCFNNSLTIDSTQLPQDLNGGYFTYNFWMYVNGNSNSLNTDNWNSYRTNEWKSIFYRGNSINSDGDLSTLIQYPGFWLTPKSNSMVIVFQNGKYIERLEITNIEFNKWNNFTVVVQGKSISVYINGLLDRTLNLYQSVTLMNGYSIYVTSDLKSSTTTNINTKEKMCGFAGNLAELIYYNYALTPNDIYKSYIYYKPIVDNYQSKLYIKNTYNYNIPGLITNSDHL